MSPSPPLLFWCSVTALVGALLLSACSQTSPNPFADTAASNSIPRTLCTQADSLNGMQDHIFGEPLRNFSGLIPQAQDDEHGVYEHGVYWMSEQESGWFGQHSEDVVTYYQFQDGKFAMFRAVTVDTGATRTALRELARSLFGPGKACSDLQGGLDWEGKRVRVQYYEKGVPPVLCLLEVYSKPLVAVQQAKLREQRQWDNVLDNVLGKL